ncbi:protein MODIFIED TRANSPORT TO THE VACUOLE 1 [Typha angustifolia]|uniref:protein MODIFIED TRANSPORT TO THE VACUOLE 1 n=1 Tax=Typha angustifolia TaxID=59011 RepID=UPI003C2D1534
MDSSRRAVEAYWRIRMIDGVTVDEDKIAPVYKLEEICELLRTSPASIVKEVSDYILKRLDHKSPAVKQKALRLIKYAVGKSGNEFRREMQRHSAAIRQLFHYKGQPDPLKGDALNKAVRDTAHEAISAVFSSDDNKPAAPAEGLNKRIQGFGNTNFEMPTEDKKSFLSEVVDLGSASIKQGLSTFAAAHSIMKNDNGTYKGPILRRSLTTETDRHDSYEGIDNHQESWISSRLSASGTTSTWSSDARINIIGSAEVDDIGPSHAEVKTREERLLETIVTSGGVRLQPSRDAIQVFLHETLKLDALAMSHALEIKLQSQLWQVRMKAVCVLESILRKKDDEHFSIIASYFNENRDSIVKCSELPQVSLREKATKVLGLLGGEQDTGTKGTLGPSVAKVTPAPAVQMPDLIDASDLDPNGSESFAQKHDDQNIGNLISSGSPLDELFATAETGTKENTDGSDPFADVSFHVSEDKESDDLFSGLTVDDKSSNLKHNIPSSNQTELLDLFSGNSEQLFPQTVSGKRNINDLMADLTVNEKVNGQPSMAGESGTAFSVAPFVDENSRPEQLPGIGLSSNFLGPNTFYPQVPMQYNMSQNTMFNQAFIPQPMNYGAMGAFIAQQQLLMQNLGNLNSGFGHAAGNSMEGIYSSPFPDPFQVPSNPVQSQGPIMSNSKEETRAFDFVSDHLAAARVSKRVL